MDQWITRARRAAASFVVLLMVLSLGGAAGCSAARKAYYNTWESLGYAKRERLVDDVKAARQEQVEAKEQFQSALEQFRSVVNFEGGELEKVYNRLSDEYDDSESAAEDVRDRIASVKNVARALFTEWEGEIEQIEGDASLKRQSQRLYDQTYDNYQEMIKRMDAASASMDPVLTKFKNRVLFLKHNLNAQAIASLRGTELELGEDIDRLIREMEASIASADEFIAQLPAD